MTSYRDRIYESYASKFQQSSVVFDEAAAEIWGQSYEYHLRKWMPVDKHAAILDVACGNGSLLYFFKLRGYDNLAGVDISAEQVALAKQIVPATACENALDFLGKHENSFDIITGFDVIEHLTKDECIRFLDECRKALKPSGRLILQTPNSDSPWMGSIRYGDFSHELCFNSKSISHLFALSGFTDIECRELPPPRGYSLSATIRHCLWRILRLGLKAWNIIETGSSGNGIFTRVFLATGRRQ